MIRINEDINILNSSELEYLDEKCQNFVATESPYSNGGYLNYFHRHFLNPKELIVKGIVEKLEVYIRKELNIHNLILGGIWINKVDNNSNKDDVFHKDTSYASLVIYLNDDFEGGEFEYVHLDKTQIKLTPKKNLAIAMNDSLSHRVLPVTKGERYSLVSFYLLEDKTIKTLI